MMTYFSSMLAALLSPVPLAEPVEEAILYRQTPTGAEILTDGDLIRPGDRVMVCGRAPAGWLRLVEQDGTAAAVVTAPWPVSVGQQACSPTSFVFDGVPGPERLWLVYGSQPDTPVRLPMDTAPRWSLRKLTIEAQSGF